MESFYKLHKKAVAYNRLEEGRIGRGIGKVVGGILGGLGPSGLLGTAAPYVGLDPVVGHAAGAVPGVAGFAAGMNMGGALGDSIGDKVGKSFKSFYDFIRGRKKTPPPVVKSSPDLEIREPNKQSISRPARERMGNRAIDQFQALGGFQAALVASGHYTQDEMLVITKDPLKNTLVKTWINDYWSRIANYIENGDAENARTAMMRSIEEMRHKKLLWPSPAEMAQNRKTEVPSEEDNYDDLDIIDDLDQPEPYTRDKINPPISKSKDDKIDTVKRMIKRGDTNREIIKELEQVYGVSAKTINSWIKQAKNSTIDDKMTTRKPIGYEYEKTKSQRVEVAKIITDEIKEKLSKETNMNSDQIDKIARNHVILTLMDKYKISRATARGYLKAIKD